MNFIKISKLISFSIITIMVLSSCGGKIPGIPGADARKFPADPKQRVKKNLEEGRGFTLQVQTNYGGPL